MNYFKTVREAALEQELEEARRQLGYYKHRYPTDPGLQSRFLGQPIEVVGFEEGLCHTLNLVSHWSFKGEAPGARHAVGVASSKDGRDLEYGYYVTETELLNAWDAMQVLGALHEKMINEVAVLYRKETVD